MADRFKQFVALILATICMTLLATSALAQSPQAGMTPDPGEPAKSRPGLLGNIRIDQRLNEQVPLDIPFTDESGREMSTPALNPTARSVSCFIVALANVAVSNG